MVIVSQLLVSNGKKKVSGFIGGAFSSFEEVYNNKKIQKFLSGLPDGMVVNVSYVVYGYGDGEKFDAEKDEISYLERLNKNEPAVFNEIAKQLGSGEVSSVLKG